MVSLRQAARYICCCFWFLVCVVGIPPSLAVMPNRQTYKPKKPLLEGAYYLEWSLSSTLAGLNSWYDCRVGRWKGTLKHNVKAIGFIECYKIYLLNLSRDQVFEMCDATSADLARFAEQVLDGGDIREDGITNEVGGALEIGQSSTILYIDKIFVEPFYRGLGFGLLMADDACRRINHEMSLTVVCPAVDTRTEHSGQSLASSERRQIERKLRDYYGLLGFHSLGDSFVASWNGYRLPEAREVCPHLF